MSGIVVICLIVKHTHGTSDIKFGVVGYALANDRESTAIWK